MSADICTFCRVLFQRYQLVGTYFGTFSRRGSSINYFNSFSNLFETIMYFLKICAMRAMSSVRVGQSLIRSMALSLIALFHSFQKSDWAITLLSVFSTERSLFVLLLSKERPKNDRLIALSKRANERKWARKERMIESLFFKSKKSAIAQPSVFFYFVLPRIMVWRKIICSRDRLIMIFLWGVRGH